MASYAKKPAKPDEPPAFEPVYYDVTAQVAEGEVDFWIENDPYPVIGKISEDVPDDSMLIWGLRDSAGEYFTAPPYLDFRGFRSRFNSDAPCAEDQTPEDWDICFPTPDVDGPPTRQFRVVQIWPEDNPDTAVDAIVQINS